MARTGGEDGKAFRERPEDFLYDPDTEIRTAEELKALLRRAEEAYALLLREDPGEDSDGYADWLDRLEALDDRMDEWTDLLEELENEAGL